MWIGVLQFFFQVVGKAGLVEQSVWLLESGVGDAFDVHVDPLEECLVVLLASYRTRAPVGVLRAVQAREALFERVACVPEVDRGLFHGALSVVDLLLDLPLFSGVEVGGEVAASQRVEQPVLLGEKVLGDGLLALEFEGGEAVPVVEGSVGQVAQPFCLRFRQREHAVVGLDGFLDEFDWQVR